MSNVCPEFKAINLMEDILNEGELVIDDDGNYDETMYVQEDRDRVRCMVQRVLFIAR